MRDRERARAGRSGIRSWYPPVLLSIVTVLLLMPIAALARRFLPAWRDRERLRQYYAGEAAYTGAHVGRLFDALRARAAKRPVVPALTADHGEEFWDHGRFQHGHDYYGEVSGSNPYGLPAPKPWTRTARGGALCGAEGVFSKPCRQRR